MALDEIPSRSGVLRGSGAPAWATRLEANTNESANESLRACISAGLSFPGGS